MIFCIPKSKSYLQQFTYLKNKQIQQYHTLKKNNTLNERTHSFKFDNRSKSMNCFYPDSQTASPIKYVQTPKKRLIYSHKRSKSYDKYLLQNKKIVEKQIYLRNLTTSQKKIYQDSQDNKNIYSGKKLVDPIHQKYKYCVQNQGKPKIPFLVSEFLLEPCKIVTKKLELRPYTSQSFYPCEDNSAKISQNVTKRNNSSLVRTHQSTWSKGLKDDFNNKFKKQAFQFSNELLSVKSKTKNYSVQPWDMDPYSNNMESIKIH